MNRDAMTPCARWTPDCQGKQDYDGRLLDISTRYWPRGGGFTEITGGRAIENAERPHIPPAASASILLRYGEPDEHGYGEYETVVQADFEGETEAEVKAQVETWVRDRFREITRLSDGLLREPCSSRSERSERRPVVTAQDRARAEWRPTCFMWTHRASAKSAAGHSIQYTSYRCASFNSAANDLGFRATVLRREAIPISLRRGCPPHLGERGGDGVDQRVELSGVVGGIRIRPRPRHDEIARLADSCGSRPRS